MLGIHKYRCVSCKKEFPSGKIRYGRDGKSVFCIGCYEKSCKEELQKEKKDRSASAAIPTDNLVLVCTKCMYKFYFNPKAKTKLRCPYCGEATHVKKDLTADKILEEVSGM